jgi:hypothetical protein
MPAKNLTRPQGPGQVCIDNCIPIFFGKIQCRCPPGAARAVDEYVNLSKFTNRCIQQFFERLAIGNIRSHANGSAASFLYIRGGRIDLFAAARRWDYICAGFCETVSDRSSNSGCATYDNGYFAG